MDTVAIANAQQDLQRLRGSMTQSSIAKRLSVDASRVSRLENGDLQLGLQELEQYLSAIGTDETDEYFRYFNQTWTRVKRPAFWHPSRIALWEAEEVFTLIDSFVATHELTQVLRAQVDLLAHSLSGSVAALDNLEYKIAFVGDIGAGKSTALCALINLMLPVSSTQKDLGRRVALYTTTGGATVCEVRIKHRAGNPFGIIIQPQSMDEIFNLVSDFCSSLMAKDGPSVEPGQAGISEELGRALRNMAGLGRKRIKSTDGKLITIDPAHDLKDEAWSLEKLRSEVFSRLGLTERATCEVWSDGRSEESSIAWLQDAFSRINNGLYPGVSLPRRMDIVVPRPLINSTDYSIEIIDTKGVDGTAIRPDIASYLEDSKTVLVLCSRYNSAPDVSIQRLIQHVNELGTSDSLRDRSLLMVLPRTSESEGTRDDSGMIAETREDSYAIKQSQVEAKMVEIGGVEIPITFYNAEDDDAGAVAERLLDQVGRLRSAQTRRISEIADSVRYLVQNYEEVETKAAHDEVRRQLMIFLTNHGNLAPRIRPPYQSLLNAIANAHQRTIWASTRRNGMWDNLDVFHHIGAGVAIDAQLRSRSTFDQLQAIVSQMLADEQLTTAHGFLNEIQIEMDQRRRNFLGIANSAGREVYRSVLYHDTTIWGTCESEYGSGSGAYKENIAQHLREWFESDERLKILTDLEARLTKEWNSEFVSPLSELCGT